MSGLVFDDREGEHRRRVDVRQGGPLLDVEGPLVAVEVVDLAELPIVEQIELVTLAELHFLGREAVAVHGRLPVGRQPLDELEAGHRVGLLEELLLGEALQPEELPPRGLLLPPVPAEEMGEEPPGVLLRRSLGPVGRHSRQEPVGERPGAALVLLRLAFGLLGLRRRAGEGDATPLHLGAEALEPAPELQRRDAVVAVVALHVGAKLGLQRVRLAELEGALHRVERGRGLPEVHVAAEAVEGLQGLDGVALDAGPEGVLHDAVEVHEELGPEHPVDLLLARGVALHEPLEGRGLVRGVVVDVEPRVLLPGGEDGVHERLEGGPLLGVGERPEVPVLDVAGGAHASEADEELPAGRRDEGVALEVEEDVPRGRRRETGEAVLVVEGLEKLVDGQLAEAPLELDAGLLADAHVRRHRAPLGGEGQGEREGGEALQRLDAFGLRASGGGGGRCRRPATGGRPSASGGADLPPPADVTGRDGLGVGVARVARGSRSTDASSAFRTRR